MKSLSHIAWGKVQGPPFPKQVERAPAPGTSLPDLASGRAARRLSRHFVLATGETSGVGNVQRLAARRRRASCRWALPALACPPLRLGGLKAYRCWRSGDLPMM